MALPLSTAADGEEDGSDAAGYAQLPADHFSDSSESSYGPSDDLTYDTPYVFPEAILVTTHSNRRSVAHFGGSSFHQNGGSVTHFDDVGYRALTHNGNGGHIEGLDNQAAPHSTHASYDNGYARPETQNSGVLYNNGGLDLHINRTEDQVMDSCDAPLGHVVRIDGMEVHVYGQLAGLQLSAPTHISYDDVDDKDDVDEHERQQEQDTAMLRAMEAEEARRSAPLPPERCQAIKDAMQSISLGGYRPEWADKIPEDRWLNRLRRK